MSPIPFPYNKPEKYSVGQPAISKDGKILYFASDMPGEKGGTDLYFSEIRGPEEFSSPTNLGVQVNSSGNEQFPSIAPDGTLYFSSDGLIGLGGLDVFKSSGYKNFWQKPHNLGAPVNSPYDDYEFQPGDVANSFGFFSSNRSGGQGSDDIYAYTYALHPTVVVHVVRDDSKDPVFKAKVRLFVHGARSPEKEKETDETGVCFFHVASKTPYFIQGYQEGHSDTDQVRLKPILSVSTDTIKVLLELRYPQRETYAVLRSRSEQQKLADDIPDDENQLTKENFVPGRTFVLRKIYYDFDKWNIRADATNELDKLVSLLKENSKVSILLSAHTDSRGTGTYNLLLSELRAVSALEYLAYHGIDIQRLKSKGFGETKLVNKCDDTHSCPDILHQMNRRTEITVLPAPGKDKISEGITFSETKQK